jgi:hypothetical protein
MKYVILLISVVTLSSCATKNYLVGSANDRNRPARVPGRVASDLPAVDIWNPAGKVHAHPDSK